MAFLLMSLCGCAGAPRNTDTLADDLLRYAGSYEVLSSGARGEVVYVDTVGIGPAEAFTRMIAAQLAVGLPAGRTDDERRVVAGHVPRLGMIGGSEPAHWLDCSGAAVPVTQTNPDVAVWFASRVVSVPGGSAIQTVVRADIVGRDGQAGHWPCISRGNLEEHLAELVRAR